MKGHNRVEAMREQSLRVRCRFTSTFACTRWKLFLLYFPYVMYSVLRRSWFGGKKYVLCKKMWYFPLKLNIREKVVIEMLWQLHTTWAEKIWGTISFVQTLQKSALHWKTGLKNTPHAMGSGSLFPYVHFQHYKGSGMRNYYTSIMLGSNPVDFIRVKIFYESMSKLGSYWFSCFRKICLGQMFKKN